MLFRVRGVVSLALGVYHWANHGTHIRKQLRPLAVGVCATSDGGSSSGSSTRDAEHTQRGLADRARSFSITAQSRLQRRPDDVEVRSYFKLFILLCHRSSVRLPFDCCTALGAHDTLGAHQQHRRCITLQQFMMLSEHCSGRRLALSTSLYESMSLP